MTRFAVIPFHGFYNTMHNDTIDNEIEKYFDFEQPEHFKENFNNYTAIKTDYSKIYTKCFNSFFNEITGLNIALTFESLQSPCEYNAATDRIFCRITPYSVQKLYGYVKTEAMQHAIQEMFTPRSGFIPHYSNEITNWQCRQISDFDHNEILTLITVALYQNNVELDQYLLIEDAINNGDIATIIDRHVSAWLELNPNKEGKAAKFHNIPYADFQELSEAEKAYLINKYEYLQPCPYTLNMDV
jgi:hypothetical protein